MRLHVHEWGDPTAPTVVCLHGVMAHGARFRKLAEERLAERFHVLAPDLRGHGRSGWDEPWTLEAHVDDLLETGGGPAAWIGHSFGGRLAHELAARRPELVERAALLDPAVYAPPDIARCSARTIARFPSSTLYALCSSGFASLIAASAAALNVASFAALPTSACSASVERHGL